MTANEIVHALGGRRTGGSLVPPSPAHDGAIREAN